jgi:sulfur relay (sulfurtransferase) complex TusBCD TusD component (DsrE family)
VTSFRAACILQDAEAADVNKFHMSESVTGGRGACTASRSLIHDVWTLLEEGSLPVDTCEHIHHHHM